MGEGSDTDPIPLPGAVGALYAISAQEWIDINAQAATVVSAQQIASVIVQVIPTYPTLLPVCAKWQSQTYAGLITQSVMVGTFAAGVPVTLGQIRTRFDDIADADPLSDNDQFLLRLQFGAFASHAAVVEASVSAIAPDVASFVGENQAADVVLARIASSLPQGWQSIAGPVASLQSGFASVQSGWSSLSSQLQTLSTAQVVFPTAGAARSAIDAAIPAWTALNQSAVAFDQHATSYQAG